MIEYSCCSWPGRCLHLRRGFQFCVWMNDQHRTHFADIEHINITFIPGPHHNGKNKHAETPRRMGHDSPSDAELYPSSGTVVVQSCCRCCLLSKVLRNDGHLGCHGDLFNPGMATTTHVQQIEQSWYLGILCIIVQYVCIMMFAVSATESSSVQQVPVTRQASLCNALQFYHLLSISFHPSMWYRLLQQKVQQLVPRRTTCL